jgi:hypothetical protein
MVRWCTCLALLAGLALLARGDTSRTQSGTDGAVALASLMKDLRKGLIDTLRDPDRRKKLIASSSRKLLAHARAYPDDPSAVEALVAVLRFNRPGDSGKARSQALDLLKKEYVKSKLVRQHLRGLFGQGTDPDSVALVRAVYLDNPDRLTRALAGRALANGLERKVKLARVMEKDANARALYTKSWGQEAIRKAIDDIPAMKAESARIRAALWNDF